MFRFSTPTPDPVPLGDAQRRVATALAEAILPGSDAVPPADEATVARTAQVVDHLSPWATRLWTTALGLLDRAAVLSTGRRFHKLPHHRQQALLARWERDPVLRAPLGLIAFAFKFTHFDTRDVYESLGGRLNVVQNMEDPPWLAQFVEATDWDPDEEIECEVVVVGTGAGGAVVGKELAERGYAVCFVEEGGHRGHPVPEDLEPLVPLSDVEEGFGVAPGDGLVPHAWAPSSGVMACR